MVEEAGLAGALKGGFLGVAEGFELGAEVAGEVGGGVFEGGKEAAACCFAVGVKPGLVAVLVGVAGAGRGYRGVEGGGVVEDALLQQLCSVMGGEGGEVGWGEEGVGGDGRAVLGDGFLCGGIAEFGDGWWGCGGGGGLGGAAEGEEQRAVVGQG
jgi:hypothetical protein